jgi:hypothetical protein
MVGEFWEFAEFVSALAGHESYFFGAPAKLRFFDTTSNKTNSANSPTPPKHKTIGKSQEGHFI